MHGTYKWVCLGLVFLNFRIGMSQQIILIYSVGESYSDSPYVTASVQGKASQTLGPNEYISFTFDEVHSRNLDFSRQGVGTKSIVTKSGVTYIQIRLRHSLWDIHEMNEQDVPPILLQETVRLTQHINSQQSIGSRSQSEHSIIVAEGIPASETDLIILETKFSDPDCIACEHLLRGSLVSRFHVLDRADLQAILEEQKLGMTGLTKEDEEIAAGEMLGAEYGARATCVSSQGNIIFTIEFINLESTAIEGVVSLAASNLMGVSKALQEALSSE